MDLVNSMRVRDEAVRTFTWTVTSPATVEFVARFASGRLLDPMAGTGYWCYLLQQCGVDCIATDLRPASKEAVTEETWNTWHSATDAFLPIEQLDGAESAARYGHDRTLLLSWPPIWSPVGARILRSYWGPRVIFIGEGSNCGDDDMHEMLHQDWNLIAAQVPVQFDFLHDFVAVFERRKMITATSSGDSETLQPASRRRGRG